jgi:predicted secreted Zn-dependent protease
VKRLALFLASSLALAGCMATPPTDISVKTYRVNGTSINALERSLAIHGPSIPGVKGRAFAAVETTFLHSFEARQVGSVCRFNRDGQVGLRSEVTLPDWRHRNRATPDLQAKWDLLSQYAVIHESGHIKISQKYAKKLEQAYKSASAPNCRELEAKMKGIVAPIAAGHVKEQTEFDATDAPRFQAFLRKNGYTLG